VETTFVKEAPQPIVDDVARRSVELDLSGDAFMLKGRFREWESGLAFGPDLDRVNVRLAIDTTSASATGAPAVTDGAGEAPTLFSFSSRDVLPDGRGSYRANGTFTGPLGSKRMQVALETPVAHTPLIVVTFSAKKQDFGDGWHGLIANVVPFSTDEGEPSRPAHAWLLPPSLASA
jgi:hypothetical protein